MAIGEAWGPEHITHGTGLVQDNSRQDFGQTQATKETADGR